MFLQEIFSSSIYAVYEELSTLQQEISIIRIGEISEISLMWYNISFSFT
jgi:hypothetical protein